MKKNFNVRIFFERDFVLNFIIILSLLSFHASSAFSQNTYRISGKVVDTAGLPIAHVSIAILSRIDSSLIYNGFETNDSGRYVINLSKKGNYLLQLKKLGYVGHTTREIDLLDTVNDVKIELITLQQSITLLKEVSIKSSKPLVEQRLDKIVMNIAGNVLSRGDNVLDALRMGPGVTVDGKETIKVNGKSVLVMINNRTVSLSPEALKNYLHTISATSISQIEIISNPSAKYDAGGASAIINIIPKKLTDDGLKGSVSGSYSYSKFSAGSLFSTSSIKHKKTVVNLTLGVASDVENIISKTNQDFFSGPQLDLNRTDFSRKNIFFSSLTVNYDLSADSYFGVGVGYTALNTNNNSRALTQINGTSADSSVLLNDQHTNPGNVINVDSYFHKDFKNKSSIDLKLDYWTDRRNLNQTLLSLSNNTDVTDNIIDESGSTIDNYSFKADYNKPGKNDSKFSIGLKSTFTDLSYNINYQELITQLSALTDATSNYKENINALYVDEVFPKVHNWSFETGLRMENTNTTTLSSISSLGENSSYFDFFPNVIVQKDLGDKFLNKLTVSYSKRIFRPRFDYLNPIPQYLTTFSYNVGNLYLQPGYSNQLETTLSFLKKYFIVFDVTSNTRNVNSELENSNNLVTYTTFNNSSSSNSYSATLNLPVDINQLHLNSSIQFNTTDQSGTFDNEVVKTTKSNLAFNLSVAYQFKNDFVTRIDAFYTGPTINGQLIYGSRSNVTFNFSKTWNETITLGFRVDDPFYINNEKYSIITPQEVTHYKSQWNSRSFQINLNYNFKSGKSFRAKRVSKGNSDELNRGH
ncbi:outer membrane beta-barrel protein [Mucilaginibacter sp.]|uniref:outer membrane beta-barrel protein n=1 Tax=Mucilaginibacter sp. TaxID=1882438 RepID=UPI002848A261|nr:outer membrane beta-barrel protein [Mucilaginibacter sp.]MDR3694226.1 outer membrane beta-barrel protein [Mucilaginibacter sp.]